MPIQPPHPVLPPPPIRSRRGKLVLLTVAGLALATLLAFVVFNIDTKPAQELSPAQAGAEQLKPPQPLNDTDIAGSMTDLTHSPQGLGAQNTWIQTTRNGKPVNYRFAAHDPNPPGLPAGWSKMLKPQTQLFLAGDRVLTLSGDEALIRAPTKTVEFGTLTGHVVVRLYEIQPGQAFDPDNAFPTLEINTNQAALDNFQGEVRCDDEVDVQMPTAALHGTGLSLQFNEVDSRLERLTLAKVDSIRLAGVQEPAPRGEPATRPATNVTPAPAPTPAPASAPTPLAVKSPPEPAAATSPAKRRRGARPQPPPTTQPAQPQFYLLTLHQNVHIRQGDAATGWTGDGDELSIVFSMDNKVLGSSLAAATSPDRCAQPSETPFMPGGIPMEVPVTLAALVLGAAPQTAAPASQDSSLPAGLFESGDDEIVITCGGPMTIVPLANAAQKPKSPEYARFELTGRPVRLHSNAENSEVHCRSLQYEALARRLSLKGSTEFPLTMDSPEMQIVADLFWLNRLDNSGAFEGPGWLIVQDQSVSRRAATWPAAPNELPAGLRIQWRDAVAVAFDPASAGSGGATGALGKLRTAAFSGGVIVDSADVSLTADALTAGFPPSTNDAQQRRSIDFIHATGSVHAISKADAGSLACDDLHMRFARAADGRTVPLQLTAQGSVAAIDQDRQIVWARMLEIAFQPPDQTDAPAGAAEPSADRHRAAAVKTLVASDDVQVLMADGARVFADQLHADAAAGTVVLTGKDLIVLNDRAAVHGGTTLELHKADNSVHWPGPGEFRYFATALAPPDSKPIERPHLDQIDAKTNPLQLRATWQDSLTYDGAFNEGAGSITLVGAVQADSTPTELEHNTMSAQTLTLQFTNAQPAASTSSPSATPPSGSLATIAGNGKRQLKTFIADGDAKLESHTWLNTDHSDKPRVFYIAGPSIIYDNQTLETLMNCRGELLVRDERVAAGTATAQDAAPLSGKGATSFRWKDQLHMTRQPDGTFAIVMTDDVRVLHMALDQSMTKVTCQQLEATVQRGGAGNGAAPRNGSFDLGGSMELNRLHGTGGVYIDAPTRDVDCVELDYNYATGIATLDGTADHKVTVLSQGNPNSQRAQRVIWDMIKDKITLTNVSGAAPR